jgi:hypothetical protein
LTEELQATVGVCAGFQPDTVVRVPELEEFGKLARIALLR